jgi:type IX secretion system PorP/SprF family membrane protein
MAAPGNNIKRTFFAVIAMITLLLPATFGQDEQDPSEINIGIPVYSQYLHNGLIINPAYAGTRGALSGFLSVRKQWFGIEGSPTLESLSLHAPMKDEKVAIGLSAQFLQYGLTRTSNLYGSYAYHIKLDKGKISFGMRAGLDVSNTNYSGISYIPPSGGPDDPVFTAEEKPYILPNAGAGVWYYNDELFAGLAIPSFLGYKKSPSGKVSPGFGFNNLSFIITAGGLINAGELLKIKPSFLANISPDKGKKVSQFDLNANFIIADLVWLGASYRLSEQVLVAIAQFQVNSQIMVGVSYDYAIGRMQTYSDGSFEFIVRYDFGSKISITNPRYF